MGLFDKVREAREQKQKEKAKLAAAEKNRKEKILSGESLTPIAVQANLQAGEVAYIEIKARRRAVVNEVVQETVGTSKKKHAISRAVVGTVLLGPVGTIAGAATAGSKQSAITTERTYSSNKVIDNGDILLTNKRFIFMGNGNIISLPYSNILATNFLNNRLSVKYEGMLDGEYYETFGENAKDAGVYYSGIVQHRTALLGESTKHTQSTADELIKLSRLKDKGIITQSEFDKKKAELLK